MQGNKLNFSGKILSVQPRIRLMRSFDQTAHTYLGFNIFLSGTVERSEESKFIIALGKATQAEFSFRAGDSIEGLALSVRNPNLEIAGYYKVSGLKLIERKDKEGLVSKMPPFAGVPPTLQEYRKHGCYRLFVRTYEEKCWQCIWGCNMPVEIIRDHWKPHLKEYRTETFCYGSKDCPWYVAGRKRQAPGRKPGMVYIEEENDEGIW